MIYITSIIKTKKVKMKVLYLGNMSTLIKTIRSFILKLK